MNKILIYFNLIPYKTVTLPTGLIVEHYRNGRMIANKRVKR